MKKSKVEIFKFETTGVNEFHLMVHVCDPTLTYQQQVDALLDAYEAATRQIPGAVAVFKRYFLSDAANQADLLLAMATEGTDCALSLVQQPPLDGTKIALWAYMLQGNLQTKALPCGLVEVVHGAYRHLWTGSNTNQAANSEYQTRLLLNDYIMNLMQEGCTLADHCLRTWFFVQDIDNKYAGLLYDSQVFTQLHTGDKVRGFISNIRPDGKVDCALQKSGREHTTDFSAKLLKYLESRGGRCWLGDKSSAEEIKAQFGVSKRTYKQAIGNLYKRHLIEITENGIVLL